jgi:hypothetical protein
MKYPARSLTPSLATLPQDVPLCSPRHLLVSIPFPVLSTCKSTACALLNSLASLFATPFLCFQLLADSFAKRGGGGVPRLFLATRHWLRRRTEKQIPSGRAGICDHTARMRRERVRSRSGIRDAKSADDGRGEKGRLQKPKAPATVRGRYIGKAKKPARLGAGTGVPCPYTRSLWRSLQVGEDGDFEF